MRFPSISLLQEQFVSTFKRFPLALICALVSAYISCSLISNSLGEQDHKLIHLLMTFYLGMISFVSFELFFSRFKIKPLTQWIINSAIIILMVFYFTIMPDEISFRFAVEFIILSLAAHLSVSFLPYIVTREVNGFWQYNKTLFIRFLTSTLYSSVLFIGIALAFLAIDNLFDVHIPDKSFAYLWCIIGIVFNTWFFLSGIPEDIKHLNTIVDYPNGLRVFTQYVLLPLVTIYLVILYAYTIKILINMTWPHGWVSYLVIGFSTSGILALLLVWPLRNDENHKWISSYSKGFFIALFPLIILLGFAIGRRVKEYGITENRFFIIALALWLFINAIYFLISKYKYIKFIPMTLFVVVLLSGFGPFSAFSISKKSQLSRLESLLLKNKILVNGNVKRINKKIEPIDQVNISSIVNYFCEMHSYKELQPFFKQNLDTFLIVPKGETIFRQSKIMSLMGLDYYSSYSENEIQGRLIYHFSAVHRKYLKCSGFDYNFDLNLYGYNDSIKELHSEKILLDEVPFVWTSQKGKLNFEFKYAVDSAILLDVKPNFLKLVNRYGLEHYDVPDSELTINFENSAIQGKFLIRDISAEKTGDSTSYHINFLEGEVLLKINSQK